jgi:hypothetical protein
LAWSQTAVKSLATSRTEPIIITDQKAPEKITDSPMMLNAAATREMLIAEVNNK